jgi:hypothetical protein
MMDVSRSDRVRRTLATMVCVLSVASAVAAQGNVGTGPLTTALTDAEPQSGTLTLGRVKLAPGVVVREIGWDSNVFDEAENPKEDFIISIAPDVSAFARLRFLQLSAYGGLDFNYFAEYEDERSAGHAVRVRADVLLSRLRPFFGAGQTAVRTRPNGEIDVRADRVENELSGGLAFDLSPTALIYGSAYRFTTEFRDAFEEGVNLGVTLNRERAEYSGGVRMELTPLLAMTLFGSYGEDRFEGAPLRDGDSMSANASFRFAPDAVVTGLATISYKDFKPVDPLVERFRGVTGSVNIVYPFLEIGRLQFTGTRGTEYSFDMAEAYYLENSFALSYTHRLFGEVDAQIRGGRAVFDYGFRVNLPAHRDTLDSAAGGVGYNLPNRTRISLNYEWSRRRSPALPERNYDRRRAYLAWTFAF